MSTPHLEVIPRIIDTSIAASYQSPAKPTSKDSVEQPNDASTESKGSTTPPTVVPYVPPTFTQKFFSKLKDYIVPILFIIAVMAVIYIVWKYWTTYRTASLVTVDPQPAIDTFKSNKPTDPPEDLSRFLLTENNSEDDNESVHSKLSTIIENSEEAETQSNNSDNDADEEFNDDEDEESDNESVVSAPDFSVISNLINQPIDDYGNGRFEYLQDVNESYLQEHSYHEEEEEKEEQSDHLFDSKSTTSSIHTEAVTDQNNDQDIDDDVIDAVTETVNLVIDEVKEADVVKPKAKKSKKPKRIVL